MPGLIACPHCRNETYSGLRLCPFCEEDLPPPQVGDQRCLEKRGEAVMVRRDSRSSVAWAAGYGAIGCALLADPFGIGSGDATIRLLLVGLAVLCLDQAFNLWEAARKLHHMMVVDRNGIVFPGLDGPRVIPWDSIEDLSYETPQPGCPGRGAVEYILIRLKSGATVAAPTLFGRWVLVCHRPGWPITMTEASGLIRATYEAWRIRHVARGRRSSAKDDGTDRDTALGA